MSRYVIARDQFYQAFPRISTASDECWGEGLGTRLQSAFILKLVKYAHDL